MKYQCAECDWLGTSYEFLVADHPFIEGQTIKGCPGCGEVAYLHGLCDFEGCPRLASCGTPTEEGYKWLCGKHYDVLSSSQEVEDHGSDRNEDR